MAKLRVFQSIENDVWELLFNNDISELSQQDAALMQKYGEPEINVGGTFLALTANEFTLPDEFVKVRSDFPIRKTFDSRAEPFDTNTQIKVEGYRDEVVTRFTDAFTTLRANSDSFTKEIVYNI